MSSDRNPQDLFYLFSEWTEGRLDEEQEKELAELLRHNAEVRSLFVQYRSLEARLHRRFGRFDFATEETGPASTDPAGTVCNLTELDPLSIWGLDASSKQEEKENDGSGTPILGFLGDIFQSGSSFLTKNMTLLIVLLPILAIATAIWMSPTFWQSPKEGWSVVARVRQTSDCRWQKDCKHFENGDLLSTDQSLNLQRGLIELEFQSGARVILQGPVRFTATGKNGGHLDFGRLTATVPDRAKGFMVKAHGIDVTDLGTEFGILADHKHNSDVHVFKGEVRIKVDSADGTSRETSLTENEAIAFNAQAGTLQKKEVDPRQFVCSMDRLSEPLQFEIENRVAFSSFPKNRFFQSRATLLPHVEGEQPKVMIVTQQAKKAFCDYYSLYQSTSSNLGHTWTKPEPSGTLKREDINALGDQRVIGDVYPKLHKASGTILGTGKIFFFNHDNLNRKIAGHDQVSYSIFDTDAGDWDGLHLLKLPEKNHQGFPLVESNAGCTQRVDLPDGDILLPIRFLTANRRNKNKTSEEEKSEEWENGNYLVTVARCGFDGKNLVYKEHGTELMIDKGTGLSEPSLARFKDRYFLTMRATEFGYVTQGSDGMNYQPVRKWTYDDGEVLDTRNTQQHWVVHSDGLFLVYTRHDANNEHILRYRAPLFIAKVDPERLCLIRSTERILIPENNAAIGNFGVVDVTPFETWVVVGETARNGRPFDSARTIVAKLHWSKPNMAMEP